MDRARFVALTAALAACSRPPAEKPAAATVVAVPPEPPPAETEPERPAATPGPPDAGDPGVESSSVIDDGTERPPGIRGSLGPPLVMKAIRSAQPALRRCYQSELAKNPDFEAKLVLELTIRAGRVASVDFVESSTSPGFDACIDQALRTLAFPVAPDGGDTVARLPLLFKAT